MTRLYKGIKGHYYFYAGRKDTVKACIYVKDLVRFMKYRMIDHSFRGSDVINCTFDPPYTIEQICEAMKKATELSSRIPMINGTVLIHPDRVKKLMVSTNISGKKLADTGFSFGYTLEESFRDWFRDCGEEGLY